MASEAETLFPSMLALDEGAWLDLLYPKTLLTSIGIKLPIIIFI